MTISPSTIQQQGQPTGTVLLTTAATGTGVVVRLDSSNAEVARVPATVTVPAGVTSASFRIDTSTVVATTTVTITARYLDVARTANLTVTRPAG